jgi:hypothetical protein
MPQRRELFSQPRSLHQIKWFLRLIWASRSSISIYNARYYRIQNKTSTQKGGFLVSLGELYRPGLSCEFRTSTFFATHQSALDSFVFDRWNVSFLKGIYVHDHRKFLFPQCPRWHIYCRYSSLPLILRFQIWSFLPSKYKLFKKPSGEQTAPPPRVIRKTAASFQKCDICLLLLIYL